MLAEEIRALLRAVYGPRDEARGTYAQVCAAREARRGPHLKLNPVDVARRMGARVVLTDPFTDLVLGERPLFQLVSRRVRMSDYPKRVFSEWDIELQQRPRHRRNEGGRRGWRRRR